MLNKVVQKYLWNYTVKSAAMVKTSFLCASKLYKLGGEKDKQTK